MHSRRRLLSWALAGCAVALVGGPSSAAADASAPASIASTSPTEQSAAVDRTYDEPLRVQVLDQYGNAVPGASVVFSLGVGSTGAGASFLGSGAQATAITDAYGRAVSPPFVANGSPGRFAASASTMGVAAVATFDLDNHGSATTIVAGEASRQAATVDARYRRKLGARVLAADGTPIEGAVVTFVIAKAASGATASFPDGSGQAMATTGADGRASSPAIVANSTAGRYDATATTTGSARRATYRLRNVAGRPTAITAGTASGQTTAPGSRFLIPIAVTVVDDDKNPVAGVRVTFTAPSRGPSGSFRGNRQVVRVRTDARGIAVAPGFTANSLAGGYVLTARVVGTDRRAAFALVNQQP